jgi:hypothetical protein
MNQLILLLLSLFNSPKPKVNVTPIIEIQQIQEPILDFKNRITKKYFGTFITPQKSPVSPERFLGYHTGVDVEYGDVTTDVQVKAVTKGQIIYSGYINGYGGFIAEKIKYQNQDLIIIYGHLRPRSLIKNKTIVYIGDTLGVLGAGYSQETNGERRHLHLAVLKGAKLDFRGYVQNQSNLSLWLNPLDLYK